MVASLVFRDCTAVVLRRHGGNGGATAVLVRCHGGHVHAAAVKAVSRRSHCRLAKPTVALRSIEHVQSFRRATAKVRILDSFLRCFARDSRIIIIHVLVAVFPQFNL